MKTKISALLTLALLLLVFAGCRSAEPQLQGNPKQSPAQDDATPAVTQEITPTQTITEADAEQIALEHAQLTAADVTRLRTSYDRDDRKPHYDVEFRHGDYEYDYEVDAASGKILDADKDWKD